MQRRRGFRLVKDPPDREGYFGEDTFDHDCFTKYSHVSCTSGKVVICVPQYRRWCDYRYFDWPVISFKEANGKGHAVSYETFGETLDETHRETVEGWYVVTFTNTKEIWRYPTRDSSTYRKFEFDDLWELEFPNIRRMRPTKKTTLEAP